MKKILLLIISILFLFNNTQLITMNSKISQPKSYSEKDLTEAQEKYRSLLKLFKVAKSQDDKETIEKIKAQIYNLSIETDSIVSSLHKIKTVKDNCNMF